jgi:hypothetical protein
VTLRAAITGTPPIVLGNRTLYWYFRARGAPLWRRVAVSQLQGPFGNVVRSTAVAREPGRPGTFLYCVKRLFILGMGPVLGLHRNCGALSARTI